MSGHSKWSQIKRGKEIADKKKGAIFSKLGNAISIAAKEGGDPEMNFKLKMAIEQAKAANMPKDNIERAIKRGTGEIKGAKIEEITYEAFGPGGIPLIIEVVTDNKNRAVAELKRILNKYDGKLAGTNSVLWMFDHKGIMRIEMRIICELYANKEEGELKLIDMGAEDVIEEDDELIIYTKPEDLEKLKKNLKKEGLEVEYSGIEYIPKEKMTLSGSSRGLRAERGGRGISDEKIKEKIEKLFNELDEAEDVGDYYSNY
jgi:YebC/PmpR family DNA-binding regulatory protein